MKRGVNEVKDSVKEQVKDLGRGVGESVIEVADAVKVRPRCLYSLPGEKNTSIMKSHKAKASMPTVL